MSLVPLKNYTKVHHYEINRLLLAIGNLKILAGASLSQFKKLI
jgi:hypothetical protein